VQKMPLRDVEYVWFSAAWKPTGRAAGLELRKK
jgi:hypothetical protein